MSNDTENQITSLAQGPNLVYGCKKVVKADGTVVDQDPTKPVALCACGKSANKPFCDGSHKG